jgi:hypothetical protein
MADPEEPIVQEIKNITKKKGKMTSEDRREVARLEWYGGMYTNGSSAPVMPTQNIKRCLVEAAKMTREGKSVGRALAFADMYVPIQFTGPKDIDELFALPQHRHRSVVLRGKSVRVRPCFPEWSLAAPVELIETALDLDALERIVEAAGMVEGLGDNRINGYGRFVGTVEG